jgi:hypothetical protein
MTWFLLIGGSVLVWAAWDALRTLGVVRTLRDEEVDRAVLGARGKRLSDIGRLHARPMLPSHFGLETLVAWVFLLGGLVCLALGLLLLFEH